MQLPSPMHDAGVTGQARQLVASGATLPAGLLPGEIEASWIRCLERGLRPEQKPELQHMTGREIDELRERHRLLISNSIPEMESLCRHFGHGDSVVMLSDAGATILKTLGERRFLDKATRYSLMCGTRWPESVGGTNAFGTVLEQGRPLLIRGGEHYLDSISGFSCSAAPIFNPAGSIAGVLDVTSEDQFGSRHNLGLVSLSARLIEKRLFMDQFRQQLVLAVHSRSEFVDSLWQGLLAFAEDGRLLALNRDAGDSLSLRPARPENCDFEGMFGIGLDSIIDQSRRDPCTPLVLRNGDGAPLYARLLCAPAVGYGAVAGRSAAPEKPSRAAKNTASATTGGTSGIVDLAAVTLDDTAFSRAAKRGCRALDHQIPLLLMGETGSGKEVLAQAIQRNSNRAGKPFVALNCAAIPQGLIESELFGYQDGAFTGARRGGMQGKVQQADGGTLFLDEIGDMPVDMQARLLRVLQERSVTPLGCSKAVDVDISVICATHRDLKQMVADGSFREDLYYRLNGLSIRIPALRQRHNFPGLVEHLLRIESAGRDDIRIDPALMQALQRYRWPGNVRQLQTVLKTCLAFMEEGETLISDELLSDDFRQELAAEPESGVPTASDDKGVECSPKTLRNAQIDLIKQAIEASGGNMSAAALSLGISRATLYRRLQNAGISVVSDKQIRESDKVPASG